MTDQHANMESYQSRAQYHMKKARCVHDAQAPDDGALDEPLLDVTYSWVRRTRLPCRDGHVLA